MASGKVNDPDPDPNPCQSVSDPVTIAQQRLTMAQQRLTMAPWRLTMAPWRLTMAPWRLTMATYVEAHYGSSDHRFTISDTAVTKIKLNQAMLF